MSRPRGYLGGPRSSLVVSGISEPVEDWWQQSEQSGGADADAAAEALPLPEPGAWEVRPILT